MTAHGAPHPGDPARVWRSEDGTRLVVRVDDDVTYIDEHHLPPIGHVELRPAGEDLPELDELAALLAWARGERDDPARHPGSAARDREIEAAHALDAIEAWRARAQSDGTGRGDRTSGPVHGWFELTYSSYQVLPRVLMSSMPLPWQRQMVMLLEQMRAAFSHVAQPGSYQVDPVTWTEPGELTAAQRTALGITVDYGDEDDPDAETTYHDARGDELDAQRACVAVPAPNPLPGYRHGYVQPLDQNGAPL